MEFDIQLSKAHKSRRTRMKSDVRLAPSGHYLSLSTDGLEKLEIEFGKKASDRGVMIGYGPGATYLWKCVEAKDDFYEVIQTPKSSTGKIQSTTLGRELEKQGLQLRKGHNYDLKTLGFVEKVGAHVFMLIDA